MDNLPKNHLSMAGEADFFIPASYDKPVRKDAAFKKPGLSVPSTKAGTQSNKFAQLFAASPNRPGHLTLAASGPHVSEPNPTGDRPVTPANQTAASVSTSDNTSKPALLYSSKGVGALDLSQYNYQPQRQSQPKKKTMRFDQEIKETLADEGQLAATAKSSDGTDDHSSAKEKKKRLFRDPRSYSKLDKIIARLEDKRIKDDTDLEQLDDLQMPRLRMALNATFMTVGVFFLVAVVCVIIYTGVYP